MKPPVPLGRDHLRELSSVLTGLAPQLHLLDTWGSHLARVLGAGGRLLATGNGGSAAQAQHLTAELVGRFHGERQPLSAIALHAETSALTAIANDYGLDELFARQVRAHGRPGDVLVLLSTSGASRNLLTAATAAHECGVDVWAMTGPAPNPLHGAADEAFVVDTPHPSFVQEAHLVAVHLLCAAVDAVFAAHVSERPTTSSAIAPATSAYRPARAL